MPDNLPYFQRFKPIHCPLPLILGLCPKKNPSLPSFFPVFFPTLCRPPPSFCPLHIGRGKRRWRSFPLIPPPVVAVVGLTVAITRSCGSERLPVHKIRSVGPPSLIINEAANYLFMYDGKRKLLFSCFLFQPAVEVPVQNRTPPKFRTGKTRSLLLILGSESFLVWLFFSVTPSFFVACV